VQVIAPIVEKKLGEKGAEIERRRRSNQGIENVVRRGNPTVGRDSAPLHQNLIL